MRGHVDQARAHDRRPHSLQVRPADRLHALPIDANAQRYGGGEGLRRGANQGNSAALPMPALRSESGQTDSPAAGLMSAMGGKQTLVPPRETPMGAPQLSWPRTAPLGRDPLRLIIV